MVMLRGLLFATTPAVLTAFRCVGVPVFEGVSGLRARAVGPLFDVRRMDNACGASPEEHGQHMETLMDMCLDARILDHTNIGSSQGASSQGKSSMTTFCQRGAG